MSILQTALIALHAARHDLSFLSGCTVTDMPDLPLHPSTSWVIDRTSTLSLIDAAIREIGVGE